MGFGKTGLGKRGWSSGAKTGFGTGFGKRDSEFGKTGFGLQADRARPGKNWIISVCALQLQLQSYKRVYACPEVAETCNEVVVDASDAAASSPYFPCGTHVCHEAREEVMYVSSSG
jgi:hypothetical protein